MPRLRRLNGRQVIAILEDFGFAVIRITGSHHHLRRVLEEQEQYLMVPVHGNRPIPLGTLKAIYRQVCVFIDENDLKPHFYSG